MRPVFKIIIVYEIVFFLFWNILYYSNSEIENWFQAKILTAIYTFLYSFTSPKYCHRAYDSRRRLF